MNLRNKLKIRKPEEDKPSKKMKFKKILGKKVQMQYYKTYVWKIKQKLVSLSKNQRMNQRLKKNNKRNLKKKEE